MKNPKILIIDPSYYTSRYDDEFSIKSRAIVEKSHLPVEFAPVFKTPKTKAAFINKVLRDQNYDYLWALSGGFQAIDLMPYLEISRTFRTKIIGYSDITHVMLPYQKHGGQVLYGPCFRNLSKYMNEKQARVFVEKLRIEKTFDLSKVDWLFGQPQRIKIDFGGTLAILIGLLGTKATPSLKGKTLFLEHHYLPNEAFHDITYWFKNLALKLREEKPKAVIIGNLTYCDSEKRGIRAKENKMLKDVFTAVGIPVARIKGDHSNDLILMG